MAVFVVAFVFVLVVVIVFALVFARLHRPAPYLLRSRSIIFELLASSV